MKYPSASPTLMAAEGGRRPLPPFPGSRILPRLPQAVRSSLISFDDFRIVVSDMTGGHRVSNLGGTCQTV